MTGGQLIFPLPHKTSYRRADFMTGLFNQQASYMIDNWRSWPRPAAVLSGPEGSGKTHLAEIWRAMTGAIILTQPKEPDKTCAVPAIIDNADRLARAGEHKFFHFLNNRLAAAGEGHLLLLSRLPPGQWQLDLPDLRSRIRLLPHAVLAQPDDALLRAQIVKLCRDRQVQIEPAAVEWLLHHIERSFPHINAAIAALDEAALRQRRPITRALAQKIFTAPSANPPANPSGKP